VEARRWGGGWGVGARRQLRQLGASPHRRQPLRLLKVPRKEGALLLCLSNMN